MMLLYTNQPLDFNIVKDKVDLSKSEFYADKTYDGFTKAYEYLFGLLGSREWIWCYGYNYIEDCKPSSFKGVDKEKYNKPYKTWILEVPEKHIVCIDRHLWNYCINGFYAIDEIFELAHRIELGDDYDKFVDGVDEMVKKLIPATATYKGMVRKDRKDWKVDRDDFLVKSPIKNRWVQRVYKIEPEK